MQIGLDLLTFRVPCTILDMHEEEETCTIFDAAIKKQPSSSVVGEDITLEKGTLVAVQYVPNLYQGMHMFPLSVISSYLMEGCGNMPLHDLGSKHIADLE